MHTKSVSFRAALAVLGGLSLATSSLKAQPANTDTPAGGPAKIFVPGATKNANRAWSDVLVKTKSIADFASGAATDAVNVAARQALAVDLMQAAETFHDFYISYPGHAKAAEARMQEALAVLHAARIGSESAKVRTDELVAKFRGDPAMPVEKRALLAGTYEFSKLATNGKKSFPERLIAIEKVARALMAEFPNQPQGYRSLVGVAEGSDDTKFDALLDELAKTSAPSQVKRLVAALQSRRLLVGQDLAALMRAAKIPDVAQAISTDRPTLVYSWASWNLGSVDQAQYLTQRKLEGVNVIGVNLDTDVGQAHESAAKNKLPGVQYYDVQGARAAIAKQLEFAGTAGLVYLVNKQGKITDIRGQFNLPGKLAALGL